MRGWETMHVSSKLHSRSRSTSRVPFAEELDADHHLAQFNQFPFTRPCFSPAFKVKHIVLAPGHSGSIPRSLYLDLGVKFSFQYFLTFTPSNIYKILPHLLCRAMRKQLDMQVDIIHVLSPPQLFTTRIVNYIPNLAPEDVCPSAWFWNAAEVYISVGHFTTCGLVLNGGTELQADAVTPDTGYRVGPFFWLDDEGGQRGVWKHSGHEGL
ncbi:hypothetical protein C8R48DRAFT_671747 [Suillus tomentosus]|nr:hypothetical protein C8R48DRAFT_671747 [Suillus tomentosus]